jgi:hypothetical protein
VDGTATASRLRFALWKDADWSSIRKWGRNGGRSHFSKIGQNEFKNGVYISGLSLLNTCVRLRPTGSAKSHLPTTFPAHRKSRLEQWLQRGVTSFDSRPIGRSVTASSSLVPRCLSSVESLVRVTRGGGVAGGGAEGCSDVVLVGPPRLQLVPAPRLCERARGEARGIGSQRRGAERAAT